MALLTVAVRDIQIGEMYVDFAPFLLAGAQFVGQHFLLQHSGVLVNFVGWLNVAMEEISSIHSFKILSWTGLIQSC